MSALENHFKTRLLAKETQIGLWLGLASADVAELAAGCGYDWLVIDAEHGPNGLRDVIAQLRAVAAASTNTKAVVRVRDDDRAGIKQVLDMGAQTVLIPMVETAAQAARAAASTRYPPKGVRGVGAALARASGYNAHADYVTTANDQICLLVQVESVAGLDAIEEICAVDGVDGVFIGPADLAADMGYPDQADHPKVISAIDNALDRISATGTASGILMMNIARAQAYRDRGVGFLAVGADTGVLRQGLVTLRDTF
jgi:4-hydroxy-2-oxoheptanedioate aldolase